MTNWVCPRRRGPNIAVHLPANYVHPPHADDSWCLGATAKTSVVPSRIAPITMGSAALRPIEPRLHVDAIGPLARDLLVAQRPILPHLVFPGLQVVGGNGMTGTGSLESNHL